MVLCMATRIAYKHNWYDSWAITNYVKLHKSTSLFFVYLHILQSIISSHLLPTKMRTPVLFKLSSCHERVTYFSDYGLYIYIYCNVIPHCRDLSILFNCAVWWERSVPWGSRARVGLVGLVRTHCGGLQVVNWPQQSDSLSTALYRISCHLWQSEQLVTTTAKQQEVHQERKQTNITSWSILPFPIHYPLWTIKGLLLLLV